MKIGVVHGRFQPLHLGHVRDYILLAKSRCDYLIVGITNSDSLHILDNDKNPHRSKGENNPLSFIERLEMIKGSLVAEGIGLNEFDIVPFPINIPQLIPNYVPKGAVHFITIFDDWGRDKVAKLLVQKMNVVVLFEKPEREKKISSTLIRDLIVEGDLSWRELVPETVVQHVERIDLKNRIVQLRKYK
jgi:cytidyltransferase-like protein